MKNRELKDRELKIKREIEELFFKPTVVSIDNMDNFEQKEMKKIRPIKNTWYDWLINDIAEPIRKVQVVLKIQLLVFFRQIDLNKQCIREEKHKAKLETFLY